MTTTTPETINQDAATVLEQKRIKFYKVFLILTVFNNAFLALYCLVLGGADAFAKLGLPSWVSPTLGVLGLLTVLSSGLSFALRKAGALGILVCGIGAVLVAGYAHLWLAMGMFLFGTAFWGLIAKRNWYRLR